MFLLLFLSNVVNMKVIVFILTVKIQHQVICLIAFRSNVMLKLLVLVSKMPLEDTC